MTATNDAEAIEPTALLPMTVFSIPLHEAFAEWDRRYRENPGAFQSDAERYLSGQTIETYGDLAAATLVGIARDMATERGVLPKAAQ